MSTINVPHELLEDERLTNYARMMYIYLLSIADEELKTSLSMPTLLQVTRMADGTARKMLKMLSDTGWVAVNHRFDDLGRPLPNEYVLSPGNPTHPDDKEQP